MDENINRDQELNVGEAMRQRMASQTQEAKHGDVVVGEDGVKGIVIDQEHVMREQTRIPQIDTIESYLSDMDKRIEQAKNRNIDAAIMDNASNESDAATLKAFNPHSQDAISIKEVAEQFAKFEPTANGLAPAGSKEARDYAAKKAALERGDVVLPDELPENSKQINVEPHMVEPAQSVPDYAEPQNKPVDSVQFNVPADKVDTFITTLSKDEREKVEHTTTIVINEIKELQIPTATRKITSLEEYKRVAPRPIEPEVLECVMPNSGYVAYFKGCGAMRMASIIPDMATDEIDYAKRYHFMYECLVSTSIGKLSRQEFIARTSVNDINIALYTILRASDPDECEIMLTCGDPDCGKEYTVKYRLSQLLDTDSISDSMGEFIDEIVRAKDIRETARTVHESSPVMTAKYIQIDTKDVAGNAESVIIEMKSPDGILTIERTPEMKRIMQTYSSFIVGFLMYIPKIYVTCIITGETEPATYEITDIDTIAEKIMNMNNDSIQAISKCIQDLREFNPVKFSFKGDYRCPHCGRQEHKVPCTVDSLIFYKVGQAIQ